MWNGNQSYANRLIIYNAETLKVIYDKKINTFLHTHSLPAKTLKNGEKWIAQFQVFDEDNIGSDLSDKLFFQTFKTPLFYFYGLKEGQTIRTASYEATIYYLQENYEDLQSYKFYIYDGTKTLLNESDTLYDSYNIKYTYKGLDNHTVYYLQCHGITSNGMEVDTGYIQIYTDYKMPSTYGIIYAENDPLHGYIKYHTNIKVIECGNKDKVFKFENGMLDLRNDDEGIFYNEGFVIENDFTLTLRGMYLNQTATILELRNTKFSITISSYLYGNGTTRFKLTASGGLSNYILYSKPLTFKEKDMVCIWIRRINDIYQLEVLIEPNFTMKNNLWFGQQKPKFELYDDWINSPNLFTYVVDKDNMNFYRSNNMPAQIKKNDLWIRTGGV